VVIEPKLHKTLQRVLVFSFGIFILPHLKPFSNSTHRGYSLISNRATARTSQHFGFLPHQPGKGVGFLKLGDTRERVRNFSHSTKKHDNEYTYSSCGPRTEIHWLDLTRGFPNLQRCLFFFVNNRVFQSNPPIRDFEPKTELRLMRLQKHPAAVSGLTAYALVRSGGKEVGGRDLVYWISKQQGIAFEFAYHSSLRRRPHLKGDCVSTEF